MSWKKRRQWANSSPDPDLAPWFNLFTVISLGITIFGLPLIRLPLIGELIGLLFIVSLVSTPWLFLMGSASGTWNYGFPELKKRKNETLTIPTI